MTSGSLSSPVGAYVAVDGPASATGATGAGLTSTQVVLARPSSSLPPSSWSVVSSFTSTTSFPVASAPYPLTGPTFALPVVTVGTGGVLAAALAGSTADPNPTYANKVPLRLRSNGGGYFATTLWIDPVNGEWSVFDPDTVPATAEITANPPSPFVIPPPSTAVVVTATVKADVLAVTSCRAQFFASGVPIGGTVPITAAGTAATTWITPPTLNPISSLITVSLVPGPVASGAPIVTPGTPLGLVYIVSGPACRPSLAVAATPTDAFFGDTITVTATVLANGTGCPPASSAPLTGTVQFYANDVPQGAPLVLQPNGTAVLTTIDPGFVEPGPMEFLWEAVFTPSNPMDYTIAAFPRNYVNDIVTSIRVRPCPGDPIPNPNVTVANGYTPQVVARSSSCIDPQPIRLAINPGTLTVTTPYTPARPFILPALQLNTASTFYSAAAPFPAASDASITATSTLAGNPVWTVSASCTDLTTPSPATGSQTNVIDAQNVGLTSGVLLNATGTTTPPPYNAPIFAQGVAFTAQPAANGLAPGAPGNSGLKGTGRTYARSGATAPAGGTGTAYMRGVLTVTAPTTTVSGTYTGTLTFTVA